MVIYFKRCIIPFIVTCLLAFTLLFVQWDPLDEQDVHILFLKNVMNSVEQISDLYFFDFCFSVHFHAICLVYHVPGNGYEWLPKVTK